MRLASHKTMVERFSRHLAKADSISWRDGREWYSNAHRIVTDLAQRYQVTREVAAGVIAVVSPRVHWKHNINLAHALLGNTYQRGCFRANVEKALRIIDGEEPLSVLSGPKVRDFYRAILGISTGPVIDSWMTFAIGFTGTCTEAVYSKVSAALQESAGRFDLPGYQAQAIIWCHVRGYAN
jgi:hypothetical protein